MEYTLAEKMAAINQLVNLFKPERWSFFVFSSLSFLIVIGIGVYCYLTKNMTWDVLLVLFGPTGTLSFLGIRILAMFKSCLNLMKEELK